MTQPFRRSLAVSMLAAALSAAPARGQNGPPPEVRAAIQSVEHMLGANGDASLQSFADERLAPAYRSSVSGGALFDHLRTLREAVGGPVGAMTVRREPDGLHLAITGGNEVTIVMQLDAKALITRLDLLEAEAAPPPSPEAAVWSHTTWESLDADLHRAEAAGFSGVFLARHDGKEVVRASLGMADTERKTAADTVYCIGSTPIDFTVTGILLLAQRGKLSLDDPISRYLPDVPADKRTLTIANILDGRSGLPDFHHTDKDWDADLGWVDLDTAVRRILGQKLLFAPGTEQAHSHSAFGLLAAVIEVVSKGTYQAFVRNEILKPLGMTRTGFYGESLGLRAFDFAAGHGASSVGLPNIPPNWGPTSWLVMGSGGMFSTLADMDRYDTAIESGRLLSGPWAKRQQGETVGIGGSDRGFYIFHATNGRGNDILFLMNGDGRSAATRSMSRTAERLVMGR